MKGKQLMEYINQSMENLSYRNKRTGFRKLFLWDSSFDKTGTNNFIAQGIAYTGSVLER